VTHSAPLPAAPEPVLLILADISGYTRYMTANAKTLAHSQVIITELVTTLVRAAELPLEVAKLEGDAVFLYCRRSSSEAAWSKTKEVIGRKLLAFFDLFRQKIEELSQSTTCTCQACHHIDRLRLKLIVHSGEALFHQVFQFVELAGVDVIIAHRLLKNSVPGDQYLLMTEAAQAQVQFSDGIRWTKGAESYDGLGRIPTLVYFPEPTAPATVETETFGRHLGRSWRLFNKLWFRALAPLPKLESEGPERLRSGPSRAGRVMFGVLTALLTPVYLPVGTVRVLLSAWDRTRAAPPRKG
jgi:hypothetical protein